MLTSGQLKSIKIIYMGKCRDTNDIIYKYSQFFFEFYLLQVHNCRFLGIETYTS